jgi:hypothetical protein
MKTKTTNTTTTTIPATTFAGEQIELRPKTVEAVTMLRERFAVEQKHVAERVESLRDENAKAVAKKYAVKLISLQEAGSIGMAIERGVMIQAAELVNQWRDEHMSLAPKDEKGKPVKVLSFTETMKHIFGESNYANYMKLAKRLRESKINPALMASGVGVRQLLAATTRVGQQPAKARKAKPLSKLNADEAYAVFRSALERLYSVVAEAKKLEVTDIDRETVAELAEMVKELPARTLRDEEEEEAALADSNSN